MTCPTQSAAVMRFMISETDSATNPYVAAHHELGDHRVAGRQARQQPLVRAEDAGNLRQAEGVAADGQARDLPLVMSVLVQVAPAADEDVSVQRCRPERRTELRQRGEARALVAGGVEKTATIREEAERRVGDGPGVGEHVDLLLVDRRHEEDPDVGHIGKALRRPLLVIEHHRVALQ